jgi:hypothetical protein
MTAPFSSAARVRQCRASPTTADAGDAIVLRRRPDRPPIGFGVLPHAAEFQKSKAAATQADALLPIGHRSRTVELDGQGDHHHQGQGECEQRTSHAQIGGPLYN